MCNALRHCEQKMTFEESSRDTKSKSSKRQPKNQHVYLRMYIHSYTPSLVAMLVKGYRNNHSQHTCIEFVAKALCHFLTF